MRGQWLCAESPLLRTPVLPLDLPAGYRSSQLQPGHSGHSCSAPAAPPGQPSQHPGGLSPALGRLPGPLQKAHSPEVTQWLRCHNKAHTLRASICACHSLWAQFSSIPRPEHHQSIPKEEPSQMTDAKAQAQRTQIITQGPT